MARLILFLSVLCTLFLACKQEPAFDSTLLHGDWRGIDWMVKGKSSGRDAGNVRFSFDPQMTYVAESNEQKESGTYRIDGHKLYTTGENKIEKVVKIARISSDSLTLDMNRAGTDEQLMLVKQQ